MKWPPHKRVTPTEMKTEISPWITPGILKSIINRDKVHKMYLKEKNETKKKKYLKNLNEKETYSVVL